MYDIIFGIHLFVSSIFILLGFIILYRSVRGWISSRPYTRIDHAGSIGFLSLLYVQFFLGLMLYFFLGSAERSGELSMEEAQHNYNLQYWVIEHFSIMIFALFLSQVGRIFISKSGSDIQKHKKVIFYFGISLLLSLTSAGLGMLR